MRPPPSDSRALPPPALSPRDARAVDHAHSLLDRDPRPAQAILKRIVLRNPESPAAWRAYTLGLLNQYKQSRCRAALARWRALAPENPLIPAVEAGLAFSDMDFEQALRWAERALERDPRNFQMLWAKAMSERFLGLPTQQASFEEARAADAAWFDAEMARVRRIEQYGPLEFQNAFERILLIGSAAEEGDTARARRLLEQSQREPVLPKAFVDLRRTMEKHLDAAERRARGRPALPPAPVRPPRRRLRAAAPKRPPQE